MSLSEMDLSCCSSPQLRKYFAFRGSLEEDKKTETFPNNSLFRNKIKITKPWSVKWYVNRDFIFNCSTEEVQVANKKLCKINVICPHIIHIIKQSKLCFDKKLLLCAVYTTIQPAQRGLMDHQQLWPVVHMSCYIYSKCMFEVNQFLFPQ